MIAVLNANGLEIEALIPTFEYPPMLASSDDGRILYVSEGKGGTGPSMGLTAKQFRWCGELKWSTRSPEKNRARSENFERPKAVFPSSVMAFPIPQPNSAFTH